MKLTDKAVRALAAPSDRHSVIHYDSDHRNAVPGFGIRITRNDAKSWVYNYRSRTTGIERRITIGSFPTWNTDQAREEAKRLRRIVESGGDPMKQRQDERAAPDCNVLFDRYEEEHAPRKRTGYADAVIFRQWLRPELGRLKVKDVTFADIDGVHRKVTAAGTPIRANRVLALTSKCFSLAIKWQMRDTNPCRGVERNTENRRTRSLDGEEMQRLIAALNASKNASANIVRLALLTGARRGEILSMRWRDLDMKAGTWTKPSAHTKQKKDHRVPLSGPVRQLLAEIRAEAVRKAKADGAEVSEFVFPHRLDSKAAQTELKKAWTAICKAAKLQGVRFHDLRHQHASILASGGASLPMIGALLGHTQPSTTQRYSHLFDDPLRKLVERVGAEVEAAAGDKPSAAVAELPTKRR